MYENYDDDDDEDNYDDDEYSYDHDNDPYQWYYKFDIGQNSPMSSWLNDMINKWININQQDIPDDQWNIINIPGFETIKFPVSSWNPNTGNNKFQYLGSNYQGSAIWKTQYFVVDKINIEYKLHLQSHASHFIQQPNYYKGLFDILN